MKHIFHTLKINRTNHHLLTNKHCAIAAVKEIHNMPRPTDWKIP